CAAAHAARLRFRWRPRRAHHDSERATHEKSARPSNFQGCRARALRLALQAPGRILRGCVRKARICRVTRTPPTSRPTAWWLAALERRKPRMAEHDAPALPLTFSTENERRAALKFFNAAFRAEESGIRQAHELADVVRSWDPELSEVLRLYGDEEGWHRQLLTDFLAELGGQ